MGFFGISYAELEVAALRALMRESFRYHMDFDMPLSTLMERILQTFTFLSNKLGVTVSLSIFWIDISFVDRAKLQVRLSRLTSNLPAHLDSRFIQ